MKWCDMVSLAGPPEWGSVDLTLRVRASLTRSVRSTFPSAKR
jgi:hypothetical protein